jgi:2-(1,2-epoxy-1,2-dihydrophenyl)acetyl-CoA isomerase
MTDAVTVNQAGAVATITLNRPESLNALTVELKEALLEALGALHGDPTVRAVILTGAGRGFCGGQDLRVHAAALANDTAPLRTVTDHYNPITTLIATMPKPVIAAVNGIAAGAGAAFALAADFRIASSDGAFLMAFANVGLSLDSGVSWTLERIVGHARATAMCLLADRISAESALEMGLVNAVVDPERLLPTADELAQRLAAGPTAAYAAIKESLAYGASASLPEALGKEAELQATMATSVDHRAATDAFLAKQRPSFTGR